MSDEQILYARGVIKSSGARAVMAVIEAEIEGCKEALATAEGKEIYRLQGAIHRLRALVENLTTDIPEVDTAP